MHMVSKHLIGIYFVYNLYILSLSVTCCLIITTTKYFLITLTLNKVFLWGSSHVFVCLPLLLQQLKPVSCQPMTKEVMQLCWSKLGRFYTQARYQSLWELVAFTRCPGPAEDAPVQFLIQVKAFGNLFLGIILKQQKCSIYLLTSWHLNTQSRKKTHVAPL